MSKCRECGKDYWKRHTDKYFCNNECYLKWKKRSAEHQCLICKSKYINKKHSASYELKLCSKICRKKYWQINKPVIEGQSDSDYGRHNKRREKYKNLIGKICEKCKSTDNVQLHHLNGDAMHNPKDNSNYMMLCNKCHLWIHREGRNCGHYLSRQEALEKQYEPWKRIRKGRI